MSIRSIATAFIILLLAITFACVNDCWTKSSIEDLSIKEVRPKTIGKPSMKLLSMPAALRKRKTVCQGIEI